MLFLVSRCSCLRVAWMVLLSYRLIKNSFSSSSAIFAINVIWQLTKRSRLTKERMKILCLVKQYWISITISPLILPTVLRSSLEWYFFYPTMRPTVSRSSKALAFYGVFRLLLLTNLRASAGLSLAVSWLSFVSFRQGWLSFKILRVLGGKGKFDPLNPFRLL